VTVAIIPPGAETDEQYHRSGAWGSTLISTFVKSSALAHRIITGAWRPPETAAMRFGRLFHHRMDPTFAFDRHYRMGPDSDKRTKAWQAAEAQAKEDGLVLIDADDLAKADAMRASVLANPVAASLLDGAEHEVGFRMAAPQGGFQVQCRADVLHRWNHLADLKTTADVDDFGYSVATYGYHRQAALYRWLVSQVSGGDLLPFSFVVVEKEAPLYRCRVIDLDETYLAIGWQEVEAALSDIGQRTASGDWQDHREADLISPPARLLANANHALAA
jgi:exodeoxyribonuclease VIII